MDNNQLIAKMVFDRWYALVKQFDELLDGVTDEELQKEIAPGKNRGIYLLGHLTAVHDDMFRLLGTGTKLFPELAKPFIELPDKAATDLPGAQELRSSWKKVNDLLRDHCDKIQPQQWFEKHTAVSVEDFAKEPHRNKLNIIITRTSHLAWHLGQFAWVK